MDKTSAELGNVHTNPAFLALLEEAAKKVMTPEQKRDQRISWVYGQQPVSGPSYTREDVEQHLVKVGLIPPRAVS